MFAQCHIRPPSIAALALLRSFAALPSPFSTGFRTLTQTHLRHPTATVRCATQPTPLLLNTSPPSSPSPLHHHHRQTRNTTMESMPVRSIPMVSHEVLKSTNPDTKVQHLERASSPVVIEHYEHLPSGLEQTGDEKEKKWFVGSIDQGTTSSRFLIFDGEGSPTASHQIEFENIYPESG